jgi:hypothetical protein
VRGDDRRTVAFGRNIEDLAGDVEEPAMENATQRTALDPRKGQRDAAMRTSLVGKQ